MATGKYWQYESYNNGDSPSGEASWEFGLSTGAPIDSTHRTLLRSRLYARGEAADPAYAPVPPGAYEIGDFNFVRPVVLQFHVEANDGTVPWPGIFSGGTGLHLPQFPWQYASVAVQPMEWDPPVYSPLVEPPLGDRVPYMWRQCKASVSIEDSHGQRQAEAGTELRGWVHISQGPDATDAGTADCRWVWWGAFLVEWRDA